MAISSSHEIEVRIIAKIGEIFEVNEKEESGRPGALAINIDGQIFETQGGTEYDGAKAWVLI